MKNDYDFKARSFRSMGPHWLGLIFIAVGFFTVTSPLFMPGETTLVKALCVGSAAIVFGIMVITSYPGTFFDFTQKRYKTYYSLVGFRTGKWQSLSGIKTVKVFPYTFKGDLTPNGVNPTPTVQFTRYIVALYGDQPKPVVTLEYGDKTQALEGSFILSDALQARLDKQL